MYRLLIVEDEKWEREGLRDFLDWSSLGIEVAGCACNGVEGVEMAELYRPEIILTDIMMPKMDGIMMSQNIHAFLPDTIIIILSGYDEFQYAKQSFSFHAFAYMLKPIAKKPFEELIFRVLKVLDQKKNEIREREALKNKWMDYFSANRDYLLLDLLERRTGLEYAHELLQISGQRVQGPKLIAILSLYHDPEKTELPGSVYHGCTQEVMSAFGIMLKERGIAFSFSKPFNEAVLCMDVPATQSELESELLQLMDDLKKELDIAAVIGVGEAAEDFVGAPLSFVQAKEAFSYRFLAKYGELLFYSKVKETDRKDWDKAMPLILKANGIIKKILYSIQKGDMDESALLVDDFLSVLRENPSISKMLLCSFFTEAVSGLNTMPPDNTSDFTTQDSLTQTKQYLLGFLKRIAAYTSDKGSHNEVEVAKKVIEIIEGRYAEELDLKKISGQIHLTPYYIGSIFKKHTGKLFSQYLKDYRIDKAKELLQTRKIKVCHLAEAVGIRNFSYFCALFKSRFGISPGDYKEIQKGRRE